MVNYLRNWSAAQQYVVWQQQDKINRRPLEAVPSAAAMMLAAYGPYGIVLDFADASIAIASADGLLDYKSQGQIDGGALVGPGSKLSYPSPSLKLLEQADGFIKFQAHNVALWSEDLSNTSTWAHVGYTTARTPNAVVAPNGRPLSFVADTIAANSNHGLSQSIAYVVGAPYTFSFIAKMGGWRYVQINTGTVSYVDLQTGAVPTNAHGITTTDLGNGFYKFTGGFTPTSTPGLFYVMPTDTTATSAHMGVIGAGTYIGCFHIRRANSVDTYIATTSAAVCDLPYEYSGGVRRRLIQEPAATNLNIQSRDLTNAAWTKRGSVTVTKNQTGIDGVPNSACRVVGLGALSANDIFEAGYNTARFTVSQAVCQSFYVRRVSTSGTLRILNASSGTLYASVNMALLSNNWERITPLNPAVTMGTQTADGAGKFGLLLECASGTLDFDFDCSQLEVGNVATSPIITYAVSVNRVFDNFPLAGSVFGLDVTKGTLFVEFDANPITGSAKYAATLTNGSNFMSLTLDSSSRTRTNASPGVFNVTDNIVRTSGTVKEAISYIVGDFKASLQGATVAGAAIASVPSADTLRIGALFNNFGAYGGGIKRVAYFPNTSAQAVLNAMAT